MIEQLLLTETKSYTYIYIWLIDRILTLWSLQGGKLKMMPS